MVYTKPNATIPNNEVVDNVDASTKSKLEEFDGQLALVLQDDPNRATALEVFEEDYREDTESIEDAWLRAKDGRLGLPDHFDCSTDAFDRR